MDALPKITKNIRIMPNCFARSSLFTISDTRQNRKFLDNVEMASPSGISIVYKGEELRQDDSDVFLSLIFLLNSKKAKKEEFTTEIIFSAKELFELMGWPYRNFYIDKLKECLDRMKEAVFRYHEKLGKTAISILSYTHYPLDKKDKSDYVVRVSNELFKIFDNNFTKLNIDTRNSLKPMAKWLYAYYASHMEPFPHKCETLKNYCGSGYTDLRNFKIALKRSLQELVDVGFLHSFFIENKSNLVHIKRKDVLKNSKDKFFSQDILNILHIFVDELDSPRIDISEIEKIYVQNGGNTVDIGDFNRILFRCLDELVRFKKILSYMDNKNNTISIIRNRRA